MADMAASVLARLKNKAAASGRSHQLCLQLFCQEEFLRRLEKSKYAENFVLKGGLFVYAVTDFDSRVTVDVDFLLRRIPNTPEQVKAVLEKNKSERHMRGGMATYIKYKEKREKKAALTGMGKNDKVRMGETEQIVARCAANFMGRQMEN